jgi:hypothetical protein
MAFPYSASLTPRRAGVAAGGGAFIAGLLIGEGPIPALIFGALLGTVAFSSVRCGQREASSADDALLPIGTCL